jgi:hypothetical protein
MTPHWEDATSYAQGDRAKGKKPSAWSITGGNIQVVVVAGHIANPEKWVMHCRNLGMDTVDTGLPVSVAPETAQSCAINMATSVARKLAADISALSKCTISANPATVRAVK